MIASNEPISRVELAGRTGLTQQTITNIANRLLLDRVITEGEPTVRSGGRKPVPLFINRESMYAIGLELAGTYIRGALYNFRNDCLGVSERSVRQYDNELEVMDILTSVIAPLLERTPDRGGLKGIGISVQGLVDAKGGVVLRYPGLEWKEHPLQELLEDKYGFPVYLENDVNLLGLIENMNGLLVDSKDNLTIKMDYGIGGSIAADKRLVTGSSFVAGEFGHYKAFAGDDAYPCHCGSKGCLTTLASESGMIKNQGWTLERFASLYAAGDRAAVALYGKIANATSIALSNLITFLNPDHVLVTGAVVNALGAGFVRHLRNSIQENVPRTCKHVRIVHTGQTPDETKLAVGLVMQRYFEIPDVF